jgi:hypothetical protein
MATMKRMAFCVVACVIWKKSEVSQEQDASRKQCALLAAYFLGLPFHPEDGGNMFPHISGFFHITWRYNSEDCNHFPVLPRNWFYEISPQKICMYFSSSSLKLHAQPNEAIP